VLQIVNQADDAIPATHNPAMRAALATPDKEYFEIDGATHYYLGQPAQLETCIDAVIGWSQRKGLIDAWRIRCACPAWQQKILSCRLQSLPGRYSKLIRCSRFCLCCSVSKPLQRAAAFVSYGAWSAHTAEEPGSRKKVSRACVSTPA